MENIVSWILIILGVILIIWALLIWNGNVSPVFGSNPNSTAQAVGIVGIILVLVGIVLMFWDFGGSCDKKSKYQGSKGLMSPGLMNSSMRPVAPLSSLGQGPYSALPALN